EDAWVDDDWRCRECGKSKRHGVVDDDGSDGVSECDFGHALERCEKRGHEFGGCGCEADEDDADEHLGNAEALRNTDGTFDKPVGGFPQDGDGDDDEEDVLEHSTFHVTASWHRTRGRILACGELGREFLGGPGEKHGT